MILFKKRKVKNEITVRLRKYADMYQGIDSDALVYEITIPHAFLKKRYDEAVQCLILAIDKKLCADCCWYICTEDHYPYSYTDEPHSLGRMVDTVLSNHPYVSYIDIDHNDYFHAVVNSMNENVFHMLEHTPFTKYGSLRLNVFNVIFSAFCSSCENNWNELVCDLHDDACFFENTKVKLKFECSPSNEMTITFRPNLQEDIKSFLIDAFTTNGLSFRFLDS